MKKILKVNLLFLFLLISACTVPVGVTTYSYYDRPLYRYNGYYFPYYNPNIYVPHYYPAPAHPHHHHHYGPRRPRR